MAKATLRVELDGEEEIRAILQRIGEAAAQAVADATEAGAEVAVSVAKQRAPGPHIVAEIAKSTVGMAEFDIGPDKEHWYYQFFETGAGRHEIDASVKRALKFSMGSDEVIVRRANHPGMAAEPFLRPALDENKESIQAAMGKVFMQTLEKFDQ